MTVKRLKVFLLGCTTISNFFDREENKESAKNVIAETFREVAESQNTDGDGLAQRLYQRATLNDSDKGRKEGVAGPPYPRYR